jgi:tetraacyldisaccharide 4'-kinase
MSFWAERGPLALLLWPLSLIYRGLAALARWRYRAGLARIERLPVPVLVVGNWIAGGGGKTPTLIALLELLRAWGIRAGVVSRGYGRASRGLVLATPTSTAAELGDEPLLIHRRSQVPLAVAERRADAARALLAAHPDLQLIVCDDGLQHHALARDLTVCVFDRRGLGNGFLLPAGPLRQDREHPALPGSRSNSLPLYTDGVRSTPLPGFLAERRLERAWPLAAWWHGDAAAARPLAELADRPWIACAGLARPEGFFDGLRGAGLRITALPQPDHADFAELPWPAGCAVLITEKDAVKLEPARPGCEQVWVAPLDLRTEPAFAAALRTELQALLPEHPWTPD